METKVRKTKVVKNAIRYAAKKKIAFDDFFKAVETVVAATIAKKCLITYKKLTEEISVLLGRKYFWRHQWISKSLGIMLRADIAAGKPTRSAVVIRHKVKLPSGGYFEVSQDLGAIPAGTRNYAYWRDNCRKMGVDFAA